MLLHSYHEPPSDIYQGCLLKTVVLLNPDWQYTIWSAKFHQYGIKCDGGFRRIGEGNRAYVTICNLGATKSAIICKTPHNCVNIT